MANNKFPYDKYKRLKWIQSSGAQYINTGLYGSQNTKVEETLQLNSIPTGVAAHTFGDFATSTQAITMNLKPGGASRFGSTSNTDAFGTIDTNKHTYGVSKNGFTLDGVVTKSLSNIVDFTTTKTLLWMTSNYTQASAVVAPDANYYELKIWDNDTLVQHFIPAQRISDDTIGMIDLEHVATNLYDISETAVGSIAELQAITKPTKSRANVTTASTVGSPISWTANGKGIVIPCSKGDTFTIKIFGTIGTVRKYYVECDADGNILAARASYSGLSEKTITTSQDDCAYLFIEWSIDETDEAEVVVVKGSTLPTSYIPYEGFYINAGSGTFIPGPEIKEATSYKTEISTSRLPAGYTELEYIESASNASSTPPYIDTLYIPTTNTKARVKFCPVRTNGNGFFGARNDSDHVRLYCATFTNGSTFAFAFTNTTWSNNKTPISVETIYDCTAYNGKQIINGVEYTEAQISDFSTTATFKLTSVSGTGGIPIGEFKTKYYLCEIYDNNILVCNLIPAKNSSNVIGMYDLVTNQFFTNAGTGSFIAGPEVICKHTAYKTLIPYYPSSDIEGNSTQSGTPTPTAPIPITSVQPYGLNGIDTYKDLYTASNHSISRNVGVKVFDGTESWSYNSTNQYFTGGSISDLLLPNTCVCTHYVGVFSNKGASQLQNNQIKLGYGSSKTPYLKDTRFTTTADLQAWFAAQYANGTPVIVVYPLATTTTENAPMAVITAYKKKLLYEPNQNNN